MNWISSMIKISKHPAESFKKYRPYFKTSQKTGIPCFQCKTACIMKVFSRPCMSTYGNDFQIQFNLNLSQILLFWATMFYFKLILVYNRNARCRFSSSTVLCWLCLFLGPCMYSLVLTLKNKVTSSIR